MNALQVLGMLFAVVGTGWLTYDLQAYLERWAAKDCYNKAGGSPK